MAFIPVFILILIFTICIDYFAGIYIEKTHGRKKASLLVLSIVANLGILAVFKYYDFFIDNVNLLFNLSANQQLPVLNIILPIGLSFHTFQAMSYTIEVYRGNQKAEKHFGIYSLYVLFYPQLVAGPIERPQNLLHQLREKHTFDIQRVYEGLKLMLWGLFKKVVIADRLALYVNQVYGDPGNWPGSNLIVATVFFAIQIYCDFSGYSDIAIGSAKVMGIKLMTNFNRPYFARNIQEFWKRWHISLSTWFRDYLYIPIGGNQGSRLRVYENVATVFIISGFWHGANWTFVIWGAIHAALVIAYMVYKSIFRKQKNSVVGDALSIIITFFFVSLAWVFFRAENVREAVFIISKMFGADWGSFKLFYGTESQFVDKSAIIAIFTILILFINERFQNVQQTTLNNRPYSDVLFNCFILFSVISLGVFQRMSFIYFQF
jgi:D-alanyl-lipoteichoic acid acyltransferase DltB (MBOAT superfamily)